jgi:hypothetical protein
MTDEMAVNILRNMYISSYDAVEHKITVKHALMANMAIDHAIAALRERIERNETNGTF